MRQDATTVKMVIIALAIIAGLVITGSFALLYIGKPVPGELLGIAVAAAAALGAILSSTHSQQPPTDPPSPVTVVNPPNDPVHTDQVS